MPRSTKFAPLALLFFTILIGHARAESNLTRPPGTTRYAPMVAQLKSLLAYDKAHGEGRMELSSIGRSVKGREIWMVTLHEPSVVTRPRPLPRRRGCCTYADSTGMSRRAPRGRWRLCAIW
jgi:hypothetical protein